VVEFAAKRSDACGDAPPSVAGDGPIKPVRFDDGFLVAERRGAMVGSLGNQPFQLDPAILKIAGSGVRRDGQ